MDLETRTPSEIANCLRGALLLVLAILAAGCGVFTDYNQTMAPARAAFGAGDFEQARQEIVIKMKGDKGQNEARLNPWLELGMVEHAAGRFAQSAHALAIGAAIIRDHENKAVVSASKTAAEAASFVVNEKIKPYYGEGFEKILIHTFQSLNYLMQNKWEGARVEARRGWTRQGELAKAHEKELADARRWVEEHNAEAQREQEAAPPPPPPPPRPRPPRPGQRANAIRPQPRLQAQNAPSRRPPTRPVDFQALNRKVQAAYQDQDPVATRLANSYQNAFTHFLAATVYNSMEERNEAYLELKRAQRLRPQAACLGPVLIETAVAGGFREDLKKWEGVFDLQTSEVLDDARQNPAELIVIFENGWAPLKRQASIDLPTPAGLVRLAIPIYEPAQGASQPLLVQVAGRSVPTTLLGDIEAQAVRALRDRMVVLAVKMVLRVTARALVEYKMMEKAREDGNDVGYIFALLAASAVNMVLEQADLRSWSLLPRDLQVARLRLPEGPTQVNLQLQDGSGATQKLRLVLRSDQPNVILVRTTGTGLFTHTNARESLN